MSNQTYTQPVQFLKGVGPGRARLLAKLGIETVGDVLEHFPRKYERVGQLRAIAEAVFGPEDIQRVRGRIIAATDHRPRRRLHLSKITVQDDSGALTAVWFNQPYVLQRLTVGNWVTLTGKIQRQYGRIQMANPTYQLHPDAVDTDPLLPIYPATTGVTQKLLRNLVRQALALAGSTAVTDFLPEALRKKHGFMERHQAIGELHFPSDGEQYRLARRRLAFEELFLLQLAMGLVRGKLTENTKGIAHPSVSVDGDAEQFFQRLPYRPTKAQVRVVKEILSDMAAPRSMQRLLQGDVGAGKTMVAAAALWQAARSGYQAMLMAPTEILAAQHYRSLQELLAPWQISVELLTGSVKRSRREEILRSAVDGHLQVLVGTHALLNEDVLLPRLSLAVTDEQHRFGVRQRSRLAGKGVAPDVLVMTATPIPRTLALAFYGDLDVSVLDELPPGRRPVRTYWLPSSQRRRVYGFVKKQVESGRQAYVVCPVIDESSDSDMKAAESWHRSLARALPGLTVVLLHGRMSAGDKYEIMESFRRGEVDLLVSTSLIEVGVDVPNATLMVIEDAHRFGLAQLHQLRGRVGRGHRQSYCFLVSDPPTPVARQRLKVMEQTSDGFQVAEQDLALRGPGELLGTRQHGLPDLKVADLAKDLPLLQLARHEARSLLARDPQLKRPEHRPLLQRLVSVYRGHLATYFDGYPTGRKESGGVGEAFI